MHLKIREFLWNENSAKHQKNIKNCVNKIQQI